MEVEGWILDAYPGNPGEMVVWVKKADGSAVRLADRWQNAIYVASGSRPALEYLSRRREIQPFVSSINFVKKRVEVSDYEEKEVLQLVLKHAGQAERLAKVVERLESYEEYKVYNADLLPAQTYFIEKDLFPLARIKAQQTAGGILWQLHDSTMAEDYEIPPLRRAWLSVKVNTSKVIPIFTDEIKQITIKTEEKTIEIKDGSEREKLLGLADAIKELDPDLLFVERGDEFTMHYLAERAYQNGILNQLILSRDPVPIRRMENRGTSYFAYGRILYTATSQMLYGRINLDADNYFVFEECGLEGLFEIARLCRMPLHKGSRASIGKCLSSMQFYLAFKDNLLIPWKPTRAEVPKTGKTLLVGDRGGFIYEPRMGVHEQVGEIDYVSLYPFIMKKYNISAESVLCKCCPDSDIRVPDVDYNICKKRPGIIPRSLEPILLKRISYKKRKREATNPEEKKFSARVDALKGILVCSFGYLSYRNAKFGLIDCHIAVCAYARKIMLQTARIAERRGFEVVHGIVDSLWVKKPGARREDYNQLCKEIEEEVGLPLSFEGVYKWIAFLPSRMHEDVPVLNRYFGVFEDGSMKVRGIEVRRRDTIKLVAECQSEILELLGSARDVKEVRELLPKAREMVDSCMRLVKSGKVPLSDLVITNSLSMNFNEYTANFPQAAAVKQLADEGLELMAGQSVSYVITRARSRVTEEKVRPIQLLDPSVSYDKKKYTELLVRGAQAILQPFEVNEFQHQLSVDL